MTPENVIAFDEKRRRYRRELIQMKNAKLLSTREAESKINEVSEFLSVSRNIHGLYAPELSNLIVIIRKRIDNHQNRITVKEKKRFLCCF